MTLRASYAGITLLALLGSDLLHPPRMTTSENQTSRRQGNRTFRLLREQLSVVVGQMGRQRH